MIHANEVKLNEIFRVILELDDEAELAGLRRMAEPRWDSLAHTSLVAAIESEFGLSLGLEEMDRMTSFAATRLLLEEKGL